MGSEKGPTYYNTHMERALLPLAESPWRQVYETAVELLPSLTEGIADLGCGTGRFAQLLYQNGCRNYWGVDFSEVRIEEARRTVPEFEFTVGGLLDPDVRERLRDFRTFVLLEVLEHLSQDREILESLPRGSTVVFSVPNFDSSAHVRHYPSVKAVHDLYADLLDFSAGEVRECPCKRKGRVIRVLSARRR